MPRKPKIPSCRRHKASGRGVVTLSGHDYYLGPWPEGQAEPPPEVRAAYDARIAEWLAGGRCLVQTAPDVTVSELLHAYLCHASTYYQQDGKPTAQLDRIARALGPVRDLYGSTPARSFGPLALVAVRDWMVRQDWCRRVVNQRVACIVRAWRWAVSREVIPSSCYEALRAVEGLRRGRSQARESAPVRPADEAAVAAVRQRLPDALDAAAGIQLLTAMRPGEVLSMRACEIRRGGPIWEYVPAKWKRSHAGESRRILIGPQAQALLWGWLRLRCVDCGEVACRDELAFVGGLCGGCHDKRLDAGEAAEVLAAIPVAWPADEDYVVLSPKESVARFRRRQREARKSKVQPSQVDRSKPHPAKTPGERYLVTSYSAAVRKACAAAGVPRWHPHQLRHNAATRLRAAYGLEVARQILGHSHATMTELYAEEDLSPAMAAILKAG